MEKLNKLLFDPVMVIKAEKKEMSFNGALTLLIISGLLLGIGIGVLLGDIGTAVLAVVVVAIVYLVMQLLYAAVVKVVFEILSENKKGSYTKALDAGALGSYPVALGLFLLLVGMKIMGMIGIAGAILMVILGLVFVILVAVGITTTLKAYSDLYEIDFITVLLANVAISSVISVLIVGMYMAMLSAYLTVLSSMMYGPLMY